MATAAKTTANKKPAGAADKGIRVQTRSGAAFRRGGIEFGGAPVEIALSDLTPEQLEAIRDEPMLVVVDVDIKAAQA